MEILFFTSAISAEIIGTIVGFGSSTIFLPLALLFVDFRTALILVAIFHAFGNIGRVSFFRHGLEKTVLLRFGLPSIIFTLIGALLVGFVSQLLLKGILGVFLVIYSLLTFWKSNLEVKSTVTNSVVGGGLSGFLAGLIGTGGALRGAFLTSFGISSEKYIATTAAIALSVDVTRIPVYFFQGFLESKYYWFIPVLFVIALTGSFIGRQIVNKIPQKQFKKIVLGAIFVIGLKLFMISFFVPNNCF